MLVAAIAGLIVLAARMARHKGQDLHEVVEEKTLTHPKPVKSAPSTNKEWDSQKPEWTELPKKHPGDPTVLTQKYNLFDTDPYAEPKHYHIKIDESIAGDNDELREFIRQMQPEIDRVNTENVRKEESRDVEEEADTEEVTATDGEG